MWISRRSALMGIGTAALVLAAGTRHAAADKLTEANMTQRDYNRITRTENSVKGDDAAKDPKVGITPVHDLTRGERKDLETNGRSVRVIRGKDWERETPEQRDAHLRRIKATAPEGTIFLIEVPSGNVWLLPPMDTDKDTERRSGSYREWKPAEFEALPVSVSPIPQTAQSDRRASGPVRIVRSEVK